MKFFKWICVILTFCMGALFAQTIEESTFLYHGSSFGSDFGIIYQRIVGVDTVSVNFLL